MSLLGAIRLWRIAPNSNSSPQLLSEILQSSARVVGGKVKQKYLQLADWTQRSHCAESSFLACRTIFAYVTNQNYYLYPVTVMITWNWGSVPIMSSPEGVDMEQPRGTILIVDDEGPSRATLYRKLQADGYNCAVAIDGEGALWKTSTQEFDLVLLDLDMPVLSGMEVLPRIVAGHPDTCVVMMTTIENMPSAVEAMKQGAWRTLLWPRWHFAINIEMNIIPFPLRDPDIYLVRPYTVRQDGRESKAKVSTVS